MCGASVQLLRSLYGHRAVQRRDHSRLSACGKRRDRHICDLVCNWRHWLRLQRFCGRGHGCRARCACVHHEDSLCDRHAYGLVSTASPCL
jgi:hypothetical protein